MKSLRTMVLPVLVVTAVCAVVAGFVGGGDAVAGALVGGGLVAVFLRANPAILEPAAKASPATGMLTAMALFMGKVMILIVLLAIFVTVDSVSDRIDSRALGLTLLVTSMASTALQMRAFARSRVPTYDLGNSDSSAP